MTNSILGLSAGHSWSNFSIRIMSWSSFWMKWLNSSLTSEIWLALWSLFSTFFIFRLWGRPELGVEQSSFLTGFSLWFIASELKSVSTVESTLALKFYGLQTTVKLLREKVLRISFLGVPLKFDAWDSISEPPSLILTTGISINWFYFGKFLGFCDANLFGNSGSKLLSRIHSKVGLVAIEVVSTDTWVWLNISVSWVTWSACIYWRYAAALDLSVGCWKLLISTNPSLSCTCSSWVLFWRCMCLK